MKIDGIDIPEALLAEVRQEMKRRAQLGFMAGDLMSWVNRGCAATPVPKGLDLMRFVDRLLQTDRKAGRIKFNSTARVWAWKGD
jgi:hypothetical protein